MFECKGYSDEGVCIAQPDYGVVRFDQADFCEECQEKGIGKCKHMKYGRDREGCASCFFVDCQNPKSTVYNIIGPQISIYCTAKHCQYFELGID